jgi:Protein of unknown function (DUF982)
MDPCRFDKLVVIETRRPGALHNVGSVREAAECLVSSTWPKPRGPADIAAARACHDCLAGQTPTEPARQAFIAAAREAGILVGEAQPRPRIR